MATLGKKKTLRKPAKKAEASGNSVKDILASRFRRGESVVHRNAENNEIVVVKLDTPDVFYRLDAWAAVLWTSFDGKTDLKSLCQKIQRSSGLPADFVAKEASAIVKQLSSWSLLEEK